jgi:hypothetical protein
LFRKNDELHVVRLQSIQACIKAYSNSADTAERPNHGFEEV